VTAVHAEYSDVLPVPLLRVAVVEIINPGVTGANAWLKLPLPLPSVVTLTDPR
jgi:hypothetical protein